MVLALRCRRHLWAKIGTLPVDFREQSCRGDRISQGEGALKLKRSAIATSTKILRRDLDRKESNSMARDNFAQATISKLAKRVGMRCSNPNCRVGTVGPGKAPTKTHSVGFACHITAAASGGKRYDAILASSERKDIENGIWLCGIHAKQIDDDEDLYPAGLLRQWKRLSEKAALLEIERPREAPRQISSDVEIITSFAQAFDRRVFRELFHQEGSMQAFDRAIEDTILGLNTGYFRTRKGEPLTPSRGKAFLRDEKWRQQMDVVVSLLEALRARYAQAKRFGLIKVDDHPDDPDNVRYCIYDSELSQWMDKTRVQIMSIFSAVAREAGLPEQRFKCGPLW